MKVMIIEDIEAHELEKILVKPEENSEEIRKLKDEIKCLNSSVKYWKSLYKADKTNWVKCQCNAIRELRFYLTDHTIKDIFGINSVGTIDGYLREMEEAYK